MIVRGLTRVDEQRLSMLIRAERVRIRRRVARLIATECGGLGFSLCQGESK